MRYSPAGLAWLGLAIAMIRVDSGIVGELPCCTCIHVREGIEMQCSFA